MQPLSVNVKSMLNLQIHENFRGELAPGVSWIKAVYYLNCIMFLLGDAGHTLDIVLSSQTCISRGCSFHLFADEETV